jgi:hypothetical protein
MVIILRQANPHVNARIDSGRLGVAAGLCNSQIGDPTV